MTDKVGIIGIGLVNLPSLYGKRALEASGNNFGNMLFTNAAHQQINNTAHLGFDWVPDEAREKFTSLFIPAANWINTKQDWGQLADLIEETDIPCTIVGLGSQIDSMSDTVNVPSGTQKLLRVISERCHSLGVRGEFTGDVVKALGVNNVDVLGCPSIFTYGSVPKIREIDFNNIERIGLGPTRYVLEKVTNQNRYNKQRQLYQFAAREASSIYYQSEQFEIAVLAREENISPEIEALACGYYGVGNYKVLHQMLMEKGRYHTSLPNWISDVRRDDLYIGTRIHGVIAATLAGTPAMLITHDNRTRELAEHMAVPNIDIEEFEVEMLYDIPRLVRELDFEKYERRSMLNIKKLMQFYKSNNILNNLEI